MQFLIADDIKRLTGIYKITNTVNAKVYVGSAYCLVRRFDMHKSRLLRGIHHSKSLQSAVNKYGIDKFRFELLELTSKEDVLRNEQHWIESFNSYKKGYNCSPTAGSNAGTKCSEEAKKKISEKLRGRRMSEETVKKIYTPENNARRAEALRCYAKTDVAKVQYAINGSKNKGKKRKEEHRKAMSDNRKGVLRKPLTAETKIKISEKLSGIKRSVQYKETMRDIQLIRVKNRSYKHINPPKPVSQYDFSDNLIKQYPTLMSVKQYGFSFGCVGMVCRGKAKHHKGFKWKYG